MGATEVARALGVKNSHGHDYDPRPSSDLPGGCGEVRGGLYDAAVDRIREVGRSDALQGRNQARPVVPVAHPDLGAEGLERLAPPPHSPPPPPSPPPPAP